jgi:hypothetical protein
MLGATLLMSSILWRAAGPEPHEKIDNWLSLEDFLGGCLCLTKLLLAMLRFKLDP